MTGPAPMPGWEDVEVIVADGLEDLDNETRCLIAAAIESRLRPIFDRLLAAAAEARKELAASRKLEHSQTTRCEKERQRRILDCSTLQAALAEARAGQAAAEAREGALREALERLEHEEMQPGAKWCRRCEGRMTPGRSDPHWSRHLPHCPFAALATPPSPGAAALPAYVARLRAEWEAERGPAPWPEIERVIAQRVALAFADSERPDQAALAASLGEALRQCCLHAQREPAPEPLQEALIRAVQQCLGDLPNGLVNSLMDALSRFRWRSAEAELRLQRAAEIARAALDKLTYPATFRPEPGSLHEACCVLAAALAHPPSPGAAALAELAALPAKWRKLAERAERMRNTTADAHYDGERLTLLSDARELEAALRAAGLEAAS